MMICTEFFKNLREAVAWADNMADCVVGVYGIDKPGTKKRFYEEVANAEFYGRRMNGSRAVVVFVR